MAPESSKASAKRRRAYFKKRLSETWQDTELRDTIKEALIGCMTPLLALLFRVTKSDEVWELIGLAVIGAICGIMGTFAYRFLFHTPEKLHREIERKLENAEAKLKEKSVPLLPTQGEETFLFKIPFSTRFFLTLCLALCILLGIKTLKGTHTDNQLAQAKSLKKEAASQPPSIKIIPRPEPPPVVAPQATQTQEIATAGEAKSFEDFKLDTTTNSGPLGRYAEKLANIAKETIRADREREEQARKYWLLDLPHHRYALTVLRDSLLQYAAARGDDILQSKDFLQCFSETLGATNGGFKAAEIKLKNETNIDFIISVDVLNGGYHRAIIITSKAATLLMGRSADTEWHDELRVYNPDLFEVTRTNYEQANSIINSSIGDFIGVNTYSLRSTNTN